MLIYVDNLETLAAHDFARILYELVRDNRRSRILLTSRESLAELPYTQDSAVSGLEKADALQLLMDEAQDRKAQALLMCKEDTLNRIYAVTQGMPLAIKLIVTQSLLAIPVEEELQRLQATTPEADFYHFLYAAVWEKLPEDARTLLIALAGYPGWTLRSMLQPVADLDDAAFIRATADLIRASLIEHSYHQRTSQQLYDLHAMTRWFVNGPLTDQWS
jgi:hypothetical protein